jgi:signal transduction histidine kinase
VKGSVEQQVRGAYLGALAVLLVSGILSALNMSGLASSVREVDRSRRSMEAVSELRSRMAESEAAAHLYLFGERPEQLARYEREVSAIRANLDTVQTLRAAAGAHDSTLERLVARKLALLGNALALVRSGDRAGAQQLTQSEEWMRAAEGMRRELGLLSREELGRVESSSTNVEELVRVALAVLGLGFLLAVSITALATRRIEREMAERRKVERHALQAKEAAEAANRAKTEFLARMSHELRTPLNSVIGFSTVLMKNRGNNLRDQDLVLLTRVHENGLQLLQLIDDLLDLSRIEAGKQRLSLAEVSVATVVREALTQFEEKAASRDLVLRTEFPPRVAPVQADARRLRQVLLNLVGNAIKFTYGGSITVRIEVDEQDRPQRIRVIDTGIGIPQSQQALIFGAFERGMHVRGAGREGTGLGLAIARSLCEALGYDLIVESEVGRGSTFSIVMRPAAAPSRETHEVHATIGGSE